MNALPVKVYLTAAVKAVESAYAANHGGDCYDLMERAGAALVRAAEKIKSDQPEIWIFCGRGNNGGDGYVAGSLLLERGARIRLFAVGEPHEESEAARACRNFLSRGGKIETMLPSLDEGRPGIIIDALLGTGISSEPHFPVSDWISFINRVRAKVIAVDCPSGMNADTGAVLGNCVNADCTVCMLALKPGLFTSDAVDYTGKILFDALGCDLDDYQDELARFEKIPLTRSSYEDIVPQLLQRFKSCNKGDNGRVLIIAGSRGMGGAAILAGCGALRAGAGLVKIATDPFNVNAINSIHPELMTADFNDDEAVKAALQWCDTVAVGPGLSKSRRSRELLDLVFDSGVDCIADADALSLMSAQEPLPQENRIITPHPGEAGRLLGCDAETVNADRFTAASKLQQLYGGVVLLKGAGSVVCDRHRMTVIDSGSPALAVGGSGDMLTGIIAALAAGGLSLRQAALIGACIHGKAGEMAEEEYGSAGTLPSDLEGYIRRLVNGRVHD